MSNLYEKYKNEVAKKAMKELNLSNVMQVPSIKKVVINSGVGGFRESKEALEFFEKELADVAGQKPSERRAKLSEAGFKIKRGDLVGYATTLRGPRMWAFLEKFINVVLPRVRDFNGLNPKAFDKNGNYSVGITEHTIFPEVNSNTTKGVRSLQVTVVTDTNDSDKAKILLSLLGFPFKKEESKKKVNG